jgi:hypothetical protein
MIRRRILASKVKWSAAALIVAAGTLIATGPATATTRPAKKTAGWSIVPSPSTEEATLFGVSCADPTDCEAVGSYGFDTFVERESDSTWSVTPSPTPGSATDSPLLAVSCADPSDCMAVGYSLLPSTPNDSLPMQPLAEWWNGSTWSITSIVNVNGGPVQESEFEGVSCTEGTGADPISCVAVGRTNVGALIETWDGSAWSLSVGPLNEVMAQLAQVSCPTQGQCMAVGNGNNGNFALQLSHGNWSMTTTPDPSGTYDNQLIGVSCPLTNECIAVGAYPAKTKPLPAWKAIEWSNDSWSAAGGVLKSSANLTSVGCPLTNACVAVGFSSKGNKPKTLVERWNGTGWSPTSSPSSTGGARLSDVSCPTDDHCVAVGGRNVFGTGAPLIESGPS